MATKKKMLQAAAGNAGGGGLNITDVFSTYLYTGTGSAQTITNGIDLDGEGGMVWVKNRDVSRNHQLTSSGLDVAGGELLFPNTTAAVDTRTDRFKSFNSDGFTVDGGTGTGASGEDYASWTFRKAPKFFDVVTYTGDGVAGREIAHNLGSVPGCFILKATSTTGDWIVYHRGLSDPSNKALALHLTNAELDNTYFNDTDPTATHFVVGGQGLGINNSGTTYVAYLFAHNDGDGEFGPSGDQDIIKCGSYTGTGSAGNEVDLGFEPQWVIIKRTTDPADEYSDSAADWEVYDVMRGMAHSTDGDMRIIVNENWSEGDVTTLSPTASGFVLEGGGGSYNTSVGTYIYMAIRRGPLAPPESATEVFDAKLATSTSEYSVGFSADFVIQKEKASAYTWNVGSRFTGNDKYLNTNNNETEKDYSPYGEAFGFDAVTGSFSSDLISSSSSSILYHFKRAPNFFDVVAYTGDGVAGRTVSHNLGVAPEMMWVKSRTSNENWMVYHSALGNTSALILNNTLAELTGLSTWNSTTPSETTFTLGGGSNNGSMSGQNYIAYLFASLAGVSKVGSYTGNGTSQTIDCGFTSGARFILIKRTDSTGDWYVWDTERGIVAGNDPHLSLNIYTAVEVTSDDSIDPDNSGFIVNQVSATNINVSSASYIFYAIA